MRFGDLKNSLDLRELRDALLPEIPIHRFKNLVAAAVDLTSSAVRGLAASVGSRHFAGLSLMVGPNPLAAERLSLFWVAVSALGSAPAIWWVEDAPAAEPFAIHPAMLHRTRIAVGPIALPPGIRTNIAPPALQLPAASLYFFPDRLIHWTKDRITAVPYENLKLRFRAVQFLERGLEGRMPWSLVATPAHSWFTYGAVELDASPFFQARLLTSEPDSAREFVARMGEVMDSECDADAAPAQYTHFEPNRTPLFYDLSDGDKAPLRAAFLTLGIANGATSHEVSAAYRKLAAQNHPDKVARMAPEFHALAERKMRELNEAYERIRSA